MVAKTGTDKVTDRGLKIEESPLPMTRLKRFALLAKINRPVGRQEIPCYGMAHTDEVLQLARIIERECTGSYRWIDPE